MAILRREDTFRSASAEPNEIHYYVWYDPDVSPKACVQITHGYGCYIDRYEDMAKFLVENGFAVCGMDNLGHGRTAGFERLGITPDDGADAMVEDMHTLTGIMKEQFPDTKYILYGHSMGSFLARNYCMRWSDEIDAAVWAGTGRLPKQAERLVPVLENMCEKNGPENSDERMGKLFNAILCLGIVPPRSLFDWLSYDRANIDLYAADPYNGFAASNSLNRDLGKLAVNVSRENWFHSIRRDLPIFIMSGDKDPVGLWSRGVRKLFLECVDYLDNMTYKIYNGRHEIHNDFCKDEVWADLLEFYNEVADGAYDR